MLDQESHLRRWLSCWWHENVLAQARTPAVHNFLLLFSLLRNSHFLLQRSLSLGEAKLKFRHAHFSSAELDPLHFQAEALVHALFTGKGDAASGGDHAMPG